jgi:hypothetical protein
MSDNTQGCMNGHAPGRIIVIDGRKICRSCQRAYQKRNRIMGYGTGSVPTHSAAKRPDSVKEAKNEYRTVR